MQLTESSIYISLKQLRNKLYQAQFLMDKSARIIYGTPLMTSCGNSLRIIATLNRKWMKYIHFNSSRCCLQANNKYRANQLIINKFQLR